MNYDLRHGDCIEVMRTMADCSVDAVVTDPPYGLAFMGKRWDYDVPGVEVWVECLRVLKPGGHLLSFAGTRTQHRMAVNIEDAGFEIRDMIAWVYGSGFPKSLDVSKAIDTAAEVDTTDDSRWVPTPHPVTGAFKTASGNTQQVKQAKPGLRCLYSPATDAAKQWAGWGTALKPALEPITVARKPLDGTVAENVLRHGTGGINVDGCRVEGVPPSVPQPALGVRERVTYGFGTGKGRNGEMSHAAGRWPANLIHDGSDEVVGLFPQGSFNKLGVFGTAKRDGGTKYGNGKGLPHAGQDVFGYGDSGSAARFFYCAKASNADRGDNNHPTVKPTDLMQYLCRLVTPPDGLILDPFMGSGSTGKAAIIEGFRFIGIEREAEYIAIARERIGKAIDAPLFMQA